MKKIISVISILFVLLVLDACAKKWTKTADTPVHFSATTNELTIAGKTFEIEELKVHFNALSISGERIQAEPIELAYAPNEAINFISDSKSFNWEIPQGTFTSLKLDGNIKTSNTLVINGVYYFPNGNTYDIQINLDLTDAIHEKVLDSDGSETALVEAKSPKPLSIQLDTEILFSEINPGLWNAAAVTNNNGSETIVVNELNNASLYNALSSKFSESFKVKFQ